MSGFEVRTRHFRLSVAGPEDNAEVCQLFRDVHVSGELDVNQERDPDFAALSRLHHGSAHTFLARDHEDRPAALGTVISRPGWLDGQRVTTGYLCDLRVRPGFRGGATLARHMAEALRWVRSETGAEVFETVVFDDNELARKVLTGPGAARRGQATYHVMTPFRMFSVQFTRPRRGPSDRVRRARPEDLGELTNFLTERGRSRVLGWDFSGDLLQRRLADWPGFGLERFWIARDGSGRISGCLASWDPSPVKRTRVLGYHGRMLWVKRSFNLVAPLLRVPSLPQPGSCFRFAFLTHLEVVDDDPAVLHDLLRAVYAELRPRGLHFMSAFVPRGSRLEGAFRGFLVQHTAMTLYAVPTPGGALVDRSDWRTLHPGFEMALS